MPAGSRPQFDAGGRCQHDRVALIELDANVSKAGKLYLIERRELTVVHCLSACITGPAGKFVAPQVLVAITRTVVITPAIIAPLLVVEAVANDSVYILSRSEDNGLSRAAEHARVENDYHRLKVLVNCYALTAQQAAELWDVRTEKGRRWRASAKLDRYWPT